MDIELKAALDEQKSTFEQFKSANDQMQAEVKKLGSADTVLVEKVEKLNAALAAAEEKASKANEKMREELELKLNRVAGIGRSVNDAKAETPEQADYAKSFRRFLTKGTEDGLADLQAKAMSVGSDTDGGYLVPVQFDSRVVVKQRDTSPVRQIATVITISSDAVEFLKDSNDVGAGWVSETAPRNETSTPALGKIRIPVHEMAAQPKATQKMLDDSIVDIEMWLSTKVGERFGRLEASAFVNGDGVTKPRGFLSYNAVTTSDQSRADGVLQYIASGAAGAFASTNPADKLLDMIYSINSSYLSGSRWACAQQTFAEMRKLKDGNGSYLYAYDAANGGVPTFAGFPVTFLNDMPLIGANAFSIAFGNFAEGYAIVDRTGTRMLRDPYTDKPNVKFYTTKRVGGDVVNFDAIKLMKFAAS